MGASSTGGRGGSDMEPWTGVALGTLRWLDGDEDLAPRVLAMADSEKTAEGACGLLRRSGGVDGRVLWLGSPLVPF